MRIPTTLGLSSLLVLTACSHDSRPERIKRTAIEYVGQAEGMTTTVTDFFDNGRLATRFIHMGEVGDGGVALSESYIGADEDGSGTIDRATYCPLGSQSPDPTCFFYYGKNYGMDTIPPSVLARLKNAVKVARRPENVRNRYWGAGHGKSRPQR